MTCRTRPVSARLQAVQAPIIPVVAGWMGSCPGTISLGQGVVGYEPPPEVHQDIAAFWEKPVHHKYGAVEGLAKLREALAEKLAAENGLSLGEERRVVVTAGSNMGFMNALLAVADPGDEIILQWPYYFNHEMAVTMAGCKPVLVATDEEYQLRPEAIATAIGSRTRAVVTISPNNPTGAVYPEAQLREVNRLCREQGIYHIHDEAYEYFTYGGVSHFSPGSMAESASHTISLFSFSKAYGFASWRLGYMVIPVQLLEAVRKIQDTILICPPLLSQYAGLGALRAGRDYCRLQLQAITQVRETVLQELAGLGDLCSVPPAAGAFYFLVHVQAAVDPLALTERLIREHGVAVIPGPAFGMEQGCPLRVAYAALPPATAREGIGRLVKGLRALAR